jgi:hypothetical protein
VNEEEDLPTTKGPFKRSQDWIRLSVTLKRDGFEAREETVVLEKRIMIY